MIPVVPKCDDQTQRMCVQSLSVSQIASFTFALLACLYWVGSTETWTGSMLVSFLTKFAIVLSVLYYYLCSWWVEERLITCLRRLEKLAVVEWLIRFFAFCLLLYVVFLMTVRHGSVPLVCAYILSMFLTYIVWDGVLFYRSYIKKMGDDELIKELRGEFKKFLFTDLCGVAGTVLLTVSCHLNTAATETVLSTSRSTLVGFLAGISCICFTAPIVFADARKYIGIELPKRFFSRLTLR